MPRTVQPRCLTAKAVGPLHPFADVQPRPQNTGPPSRVTIIVPNLAYLNLLPASRFTIDQGRTNHATEGDRTVFALSLRLRRNARLGNRLHHQAAFASEEVRGPISFRIASPTDTKRIGRNLCAIVAH
jgi:hypothetical protein